jgi:hypothetical protein
MTRHTPSTPAPESRTFHFPALVVEKVPSARYLALRFRDIENFADFVADLKRYGMASAVKIGTSNEFSMVVGSHDGPLSVCAVRSEWMCKTLEDAAAKRDELMKQNPEGTECLILSRYFPSEGLS